MRAIFGGIFLGALCLFACGKKQDKQFILRTPGETGIQFANTITEYDSLNILESEFIYNGGGVAIGDVNGDGLEDLFFAGNQVNNALYLNRGGLKFEDITNAANVGKNLIRQWSSGVNILDINLDGKLDIYVCNTFDPLPENRRNLLYINQGNDADGIPKFREMAREYGVDDPSHSSHAQFFDYDNDGDLDLFIGVNVIEDRYPNQFIEITNNGKSMNRDNLFQNNWSDSLGHPVFTDVSLAAGLLQDGYSHSTLVYDFNEDGWQDIYVANDYQSNDLIFINNRNGTFTNQAGKIFKHFSMSAMGSDVTDINNDGAADFFTTEMQPYYNKRKKLFQGGSSYQNQVLTEKYGYDYQYTRNTLQLNIGTDPATGLPVFAEIGMFAQVQETDWSWATLFADFDNDGWKDLYIANGFPRDVTDRDFADFRAYASNLVTPQQLLDAIPKVKSPNFLFKNKGDLTFENVSEHWGVKIPSFTNGAAYGDLDNDGDLDLVTNNIDDPAFLFENKVSSQQHYLRVKLVGSEKNPDAFGASATAYFKGQQQRSFLLSGRGYLSKPESALHFGLGAETIVDSLVVLWPDSRKTVLKQVSADQVLTVNHRDALPGVRVDMSAGQGLFADISGEFGLNFTHQEEDFVDFYYQRTLPHKFSQYGPAIAINDVNGDGLQDIFLSGSRRSDETWFLQQPDGNFIKTIATYKKDANKQEEDAGSLLFDADGDGDADLYISRGSSQYPEGDPLYQDALFLNDGKGHFSAAANALPPMMSNASCVKAADFDHDGDLDLFVGSRVKPRAYPEGERSFLLRNDSSNGQLKFTDITSEAAPGLLAPGMVSDAIWTDFNNDHWPDLMLVCEWMPIQFFQNKNGILEAVTESTGLAEYKGWWNSIAALDADQDGDMDYIAGNFGENLYFRCTSDEPIRVYAKDLDNNGMIDPLISCFWQDSLGAKHEYLYHPREDLIKQFVGIRKKFNTYGEYGEATVTDMFSEEDFKDATKLSANWMKSVYLRNDGNGRFVLKELPVEAQLAPVYGILPFDVNQDNIEDVILVGNDFGVEVQQGRADAFSGLVLLNDGAGNFSPMSLDESHFGVFGDAKGLAKVYHQASGQEFIFATQNRNILKVFKGNTPVKGEYLPLNNKEVKAMLTLGSGKTQIREFYWGDTYLSQSGRYLIKNNGISKIEFLDGQGQVLRTVE